MAINYMKLIAKNHSGTSASCNGDTSIYTNITFHTNAVTQATLDAEYLAYYKQEKNKKIDDKTRQLIEAGFVYDSVLFSASETAQRNWMGIDQFSADLTYPFGVSTKDDGEYILADAAAVHAFVLTGIGALEYHYSTGRALKQSVNAATDIAGVDAVIDNR